MANGENHAKKILIEDTLANAKKLKNGSAGDIKLIGHTVSQVAEISCAMFEQDFQTISGCNKKHKEMMENLKPKATDKPMKIKIGPVSFEGFITPALIASLPPVIACAGVVYVIGKVQGWW